MANTNPVIDDPSVVEYITCRAQMTGHSRVYVAGARYEVFTDSGPVYCLDADTGEALGPAILAARTVTLAAFKKGFENPTAREYTGEVVLADIGVPYRKG